MSDIRTFQCPNCGAPLTHAGSDKETKCPACGSTVIVPKDLRDKPAPSANQSAALVPNINLPDPGVNPSNLMAALKSLHASGGIAEADFQQKRTEILALFDNQTISPVVRLRLLKELRNSDGITDGHYQKMRAAILSELNHPAINSDDRLKLLTELRNSGGISEGEYQQKRAEILNQK
jgi:DNA-directed RNA polymerase subunit RPC12/RpoP